MNAIWKLSALAVLSLAVACGDEPPAFVDTPLGELPAWVLDGGAEDGHFYGVGRVGANETRNISQMATIGQQRGRQQVAAILRTRIEAMTRDFSKATANMQDEPIDEVLIENTARSIVEMTLQGCRQVKSHMDEQGNWYFLMKLDKNAAQQSARKEVSQLIEDKISNNAEAAFAELDRQLGSVEGKR